MENSIDYIFFTKAEGNLLTRMLIAQFFGFVALALIQRIPYIKKNTNNLAEPILLSIIGLGLGLALASHLKLPSVLIMVIAYLTIPALRYFSIKNWQKKRRPDKAGRKSRPRIFSDYCLDNHCRGIRQAS